MRVASWMILGLVAACATVPDQSLGACNADALNDLVGRQASAELGADAMRRSRATRLRWIQPGDVVTMDYSESRLNIHLDSRNRVERIVCG